ncbi:MAG: MFS transporter [Longilinea sp.]|nr:MFS transporter [Longilinea sp.]
MWQRIRAAVSYIFAPAFFAVVFSHLMTDLYVGQRSVYLAYISKQLNMSNAWLGAVTTAAVMTAGLSQPLFGYLADRVGSRRMIIGAMAWIGVTFGLSVLMPPIWSAWFFVLASLGAGMYHPAGVNQATLIGRTQMAGREATASSYFFLFGQLGFLLGPLLGGIILQRWGDVGLLGLLALLIPAIIFVWRSLGQQQTPAVGQLQRAASAAMPAAAARPRAFVVVAWALAMAFQSWAQQNISAFMPRHMAELGKSPNVYGLLASLFIAGTVVGNLVGGNLADHVGKRWVIMWGMGLGALPLFAMAWLDFSPLWAALLFLGGMLVGSAYSILVVFGQRFAPGGGALASGLVLGFAFSSGAIGTSLTGWLADGWGFGAAYIFSAALALAGAVLARFLPER